MGVHDQEKDEIEARFNQRLKELTEKYPPLDLSEAPAQRFAGLLATFDNGTRADRIDAAFALGETRETGLIYKLADIYYAHSRGSDEQYWFDFGQMPDVRLAIGFGIFHLGESKELYDMLRSNGHAGATSWGIEAVGEFGDRAINLLITHLDSPKSDRLSICCVHVLGRLKIARACDRIIEQLKDDHIELRAVACLALAEIADPFVLDLLREMRDNDPKFDGANYPVRDAAAYTIKQIEKANAG